MDKFEKRAHPASRSHARDGELSEDKPSGFNFNYDMDPDNKISPLKHANQQHRMMKCAIPYHFNFRVRETSRRKELYQKKINNVMKSTRIC